MEMHNLEGSLLARGDHIKHLPMGFMWDFLAQFLQSRFVLPIILKHGESLNKMKVRIKNYHSLSCKKNPLTRKVYGNLNLIMNAQKNNTLK